MTKSKDWEYHCALLHKHDSAKFNVPTKRMRESPVIESFGDSDLGYYVATISILGILATVIVLVVVKVIS